MGYKNIFLTTYFCFLGKFLLNTMLGISPMTSIVDIHNDKIKKRPIFVFEIIEKKTAPFK